jgi:diguanylate cyclase (GGDEF)-like protein
MAHTHLAPPVRGPEPFTVEIGPELSAATLARRAKAVNALLRLAMLAGLQMEPDVTVNIFADFISEMTPYDRMLVFVWDEEREMPRLRIGRGLEGVGSGADERGNLFNLWAGQFRKPLLISSGEDEVADTVLVAMESGSALVIPLIVGNRVMGSLQLFSSARSRYSREDAQLLWIFSLLAENQLSRACAQEGLLKFAFTDYLTGLRSRGYFEQQLEIEIKRAERKGTHLALLMVDIDRFKLLNDQRGHHVGDQVLREVAALLERDMRDIDTVARYGGEEFVVILPETDDQGALRVAQRVRQSIEQARFSHGALPTSEQITISVGIAVFGQDTRYKRELLQYADAALYRAKHRGRNQVVLYSEPEVKLMS